jgi:hypothetical protein
MLILEFSQYDKYLSDKEFMKYFNSLKEKVLHIYPEINPNLELVIDKIYSFYQEKWLIDDLINKLAIDGNLFSITSGQND